MTWLLGIVAQFRSQLFALAGVLAVCGVDAAVISYIHIGSQRETIDAQEGVIQLQAATNNQSSQNWQDMKAIRKVDQQAVTDLQAAVGLISEDNEEMAQAVKRLEANDEIVQKYMAQPIPPELRRVSNRSEVVSAPSPYAGVPEGLMERCVVRDVALDTTGDIVTSRNLYKDAFEKCAAKIDAIRKQDAAARAAVTGG